MEPLLAGVELLHLWRVSEELPTPVSAPVSHTVTVVHLNSSRRKLSVRGEGGSFFFIILCFFAHWPQQTAVKCAVLSQLTKNIYINIFANYIYKDQRPSFRQFTAYFSFFHWLLLTYFIAHLFSAAICESFSAPPPHPLSPLPSSPSSSNVLSLCNIIWFF